MLEMLRFIYTGKAPSLDKMAADLLSAADKVCISVSSTSMFTYLFVNCNAEMFHCGSTFREPKELGNLRALFFDSQEPLRDFEIG